VLDIMAPLSFKKAKELGLLNEKEIERILTVHLAMAEEIKVRSPPFLSINNIVADTIASRPPKPCSSQLLRLAIPSARTGLCTRLQ
jgi:hypothetical protein